MKTRLISAAVLLPIFLIVIYALPSIVFAILVALFCAIASFELLRGTGLVRHTRLLIYTAVAAALMPIWCYFEMPYAWGMLGILVFLITLFTEMMVDHVKIRLEMLALCLLAGLLLPYLLSALVRMQIQRMGNYWIMVALILAFVPDSGAYFAGTFFGRHKLAPVISPKKTVEGVIGGVLVAVVGMMIYCVIVQLFLDRQVNYLYGLLYGLAGSVMAVIGDLCFSAIKRQCGIKDYGNLIPGHGGILDRFDSMLLVAPTVEALLELIPVVVS